MHLLRSTSCLRKKGNFPWIADKIPSMFLIQFKSQQATHGMWGQRKQKTDLGSMQTYTLQEGGGRSNTEDPQVTLK